MMLQTPLLSLTDELTHARQRIDGALLAALQIPPGCPDRLAVAIRYSLLAPGKRLRPILVLWAGEACGYDEWDRLMPAACAVEMIHAYSLIHDDLPAMDNDDLRRGRPTCHKAFDEATAILAGDALQALAFETTARLRPAAIAARCTLELAQAAGATGMVGGQTDDLAAEGRFSADPRPAENLAGLQSMHERKTGALIRASLRIGAIAAGAEEAKIAALDAYGRKIGLAFQIADDLLDVQGAENVIGKRVGKDSNLGKMTYPALCGVEPSRQMARQLIVESLAALQPLGTAAGKLEALARYIVERNH